jgi:pimeloyl-ACP methyl ester carboxylesterase
MALGHPVIVVQCPGVSMRLGPVLPVDAVVDQVVGVLDKLGVEQACVIGHSYGESPSVPAAVRCGLNAAV